MRVTGSHAGRKTVSVRSRSDNWRIYPLAANWPAAWLIERFSDDLMVLRGVCRSALVDDQRLAFGPEATCDLVGDVACSRRKGGCSALTLMEPTSSLGRRRAEYRLESF